MEKTAPKTVPGRPFQPGADPRRGNGKKGRSGRKSNAFLARCIAATEDDGLWHNAKKKQPLGTLDLAASYVHGKPKQTTEHTGDLTVRVLFDE